MKHLRLYEDYKKNQDDYIKVEFTKKSQEVKDLLDKFKIPYEVNKDDQRTAISILFFFNSHLCTVYLYKPNRENRVAVSFLDGSIDGLPYYPKDIGELKDLILNKVDISTWMKKINEEFDPNHVHPTDYILQRLDDREKEITSLFKELGIPYTLEHLEREVGFLSRKVFKFNFSKKQHSIVLYRPQDVDDVIFAISSGGRTNVTDIRTKEDLKSEILKRVDISGWMRKINEDIFDTVQIRNKERLSNKVRDLLVELNIPYHMGTIDKSIFIFEYDDESYGIQVEISRSNGELFMTLLKEGYQVSKSFNIDELKYNILNIPDASVWLKKINENGQDGTIWDTLKNMKIPGIPKNFPEHMTETDELICLIFEKLNIEYIRHFGDSDGDSMNTFLCMYTINNGLVELGVYNEIIGDGSVIIIEDEENDYNYETLSGPYELIDYLFELNLINNDSWMRKINEDVFSDVIENKRKKLHTKIESILRELKIPIKKENQRVNSDYTRLSYVFEYNNTEYGISAVYNGSTKSLIIILLENGYYRSKIRSMNKLKGGILNLIDTTPWMKKINEGLSDDPEFEDLNSEIKSLLKELRIPHHTKFTMREVRGESDITRQIADQRGLEYVDLRMNISPYKNSTHNIKLKINGDDYTIFAFRPEGSTDHKIKFYGEGTLVEVENIEELRSAILSKVDISSWMKGINEVYNLTPDGVIWFVRQQFNEREDEIISILKELKIPYKLQHSHILNDKKSYVFNINNSTCSVHLGKPGFSSKIRIIFHDGEKFIEVKDKDELKNVILRKVDISGWMKKINESSFSNDIYETIPQVRSILDKYKMTYTERRYENKNVNLGYEFTLKYKGKDQIIFIEEEYDESFRIGFVIDTETINDTYSIYTSDDLEFALEDLVQSDTQNALLKINEGYFPDDIEKSVDKISKILDKFNIDYELEDTLYLYKMSGDDHVIGSKSIFFDFKGDRQEIFVELHDNNTIRVGFHKQTGSHSEHNDIYEESEIIHFLNSLVEDETLSAVRKINEDDDTYLDNWDLPTDIDECMDYVKGILNKAHIKYKETKSSTSFKFKLKDNEYYIIGEQYITVGGSGYAMVIYITDSDNKVYADINGCTSKAEFVVEFLKIYNVDMTNVIKKMNDFDI